MEQESAALQVRIRPATIDDLMALAQMQLEYWQEYRYPHVMQDAMQQTKANLMAGTDYVLAQHAAERAIGFANGQATSHEEYYLSYIYVQKKFRRQGVGSLLLEALKETARKKACTSIISYIGVENIESINLHKKSNGILSDDSGGYKSVIPLLKQ